MGTVTMAENRFQNEALGSIYLSFWDLYEDSLETDFSPQIMLWSE